MAVICDELPYVAFTQVRNAWLRDRRISWKAKGLLAYCRSHAAGYRLSHAQMVREATDGKDSVTTALRELEAAGYLTRVINRAGGRYAEDDYRLTDPFDLAGNLLPQPETRQSHAEDGRKIRQTGKSALADLPDRQTRPIEEQGENTKESPTDSPSAAQLRLVEHPSPPGLTAAALFDTFWAAYPRKVSKDAARRAWAKAARRADPAVILAAVRAYPWPKDVQYVPHPTTWLNGGRWEDDPAAVNPDARVTGANYGPRYQDPDPHTHPDAFSGSF